MTLTVVLINTISRWLNYLGAIPMLILGIIGAILTIIIYMRRRSYRCNPAINYLLAGSIMTAIHLPSVYLQLILVDGFGLNFINGSDNGCRQFQYLLYVTTVPIVFFPCWAAFDQYAATSRDTLFRNRWNSLGTARFAIYFTIIITMIIYLPNIFLSGISNGYCTILHYPYRIFHNYILTTFVFTLGPFVFVTIFSIGIIRNLRLSVYINRNNNLTKQIRGILIPQLIILILTGIPYGILNIYLNATNNTQKDAVRLSIEKLSLQIVRLFYHLNYVTVYCIYIYRNYIRKIFNPFFNKSAKDKQTNAFHLKTFTSMTNIKRRI